MWEHPRPFLSLPEGLTHIYSVRRNHCALCVQLAMGTPVKSYRILGGNWFLIQNVFRVSKLGLTHYDWIFWKSQGDSESWLCAGHIESYSRTNASFGSEKRPSLLSNLIPSHLPHFPLLAQLQHQAPASFAALQTQRACSDFKPLPLSFLSLHLLSSKSQNRVAFPIKMALHSLPNYSNTPFTLLDFIPSTYPNLTYCIFASAF